MHGIIGDIIDWDEAHRRYVDGKDATTDRSAAGAAAIEGVDGPAVGDVRVAGAAIGAVVRRSADGGTGRWQVA
jgi:hypothetical protein